MKAGIEPHGSCPSDFELDALWLKGQVAKPTGAWEEHLGRCPACRARASGRLQVAEEFRRAIFPATAGRVAERAALLGTATDEPGPRLALGWHLGFVLAVGLVLVIAAWTLWPIGHSASGFKGALGLEVWCKRGDQVVRAHQGDVLLPGDVLRFVVAPPAPGFAMVVAVDADGRANLYAPLAPDVGGAARVEAGAQPLDGGTALDESSGAERIFAIFALRSFRFEDVQAAVTAGLRGTGNIDQLSALPLPEGFAQASLLFRKGIR